MFHNSTTRRCKKLQRCPCGIPLEPSETALEHPSVWTLVGSEDSDLLQIAKQIYKGEYIVAPSIFSCSQCDDLLKKLQKKLSKHLTQAGLQGERGPAEASFRTWRHSCRCEGEEYPALEARPQGMWSQSRGRRTHSRGKVG